MTRDSNTNLIPNRPSLQLLHGNYLLIELLAVSLGQATGAALRGFRSHQWRDPEFQPTPAPGPDPAPASPAGQMQKPISSSAASVVAPASASGSGQTDRQLQDRGRMAKPQAGGAMSWEREHTRDVVQELHMGATLMPVTSPGFSPSQCSRLALFPDFSEFLLDSHSCFPWEVRSVS